MGGFEGPKKDGSQQCRPELHQPHAAAPSPSLPFILPSPNPMNFQLYYVIQEPGTAPGSKPTPIDDDIGMVVNDSTTPVKTSQIHEARDAMNLTMEKVGKMVQGMEGVTVEGLIEFGNAGENVCHKVGVFGLLSFEIEEERQRLTSHFIPQAKAIRAKFVVVGTRGTSSTWRG